MAALLEILLEGIAQLVVECVGFVIETLFPTRRRRVLAAGVATIALIAALIWFSMP